MKFTNTFDKYACIGDSLMLDAQGFTFEARVEYDEQADIDDDDCHNVDQSVTGCDDEQFAKLLAARKAYANDEWQYVGIVVSVSKNDIVLDKHAASLWGIEMNYPDSDNDHLTDVANELLAEALDVGKTVLATLTE